jgi:uncharacterized protein (DUF1697 family)
MKAWVALLRGVNVGGVKVPMAPLKAVAEKAGYERVKTYIASGNLLFASGESEAAIRDKLEGLIEQEFGRRIGVLVRSADELAEVSKHNPYAGHPGKWTVAIFVDRPLSLDGLRHQDDEQVALGKRAVYAWYPRGQARTRLVIPCAKDGTARNMNTVATLAAMGAGIAKEIEE